MKVNFGKSAGYVLIPLAALGAGYVGGRVHQQSSDLAAIGKIYYVLHNASTEHGTLLVAKEMADKNPAVFGLAEMVEQARRSAGNKYQVPTYGEIHDMLERTKD